MKNRSKAIAPVIIVVIFIVAIVAAGVVVYVVVVKPPAQWPGPGPGPGPGVEIYEINDYGDLVNFASHITYEWTSYDASTDTTSTSTVTFDDKGDATVGVDICRKFEIEITSDEDTTEIAVWVLKSDWTTIKKLTIGGIEYSSEYGTWIGPAVFWPYTIFFGWGINWAYVPPEVGTLQYISQAMITYGATTLTVNKWLFTPNPANYPDLSSIDLWQGQTGSYYILTKFKVTETDNDYFEFELLELTMP